MNRNGPCVRWGIALGCLALLGPVIGCDSHGDVKLIPVSGTVTLDGKPLPGAGVSFRADAAKGNTSQHIPSGTVDAGGNYELVTATRKGAPPGWYKVVVFPPVPPKMGGDAPKVGPPPYDRKYSNPATTDWSVEVKDKPPPRAFDIALKSTSN